MCLCENDGNDKGCCWYSGSYVGVWVFGILQAMIVFVSVVQLLAFPVEEQTQKLEGLNDKQKEQEAFSIKLTTFYTCLLTLFGLAPFILVLFKRESSGARLWLFVTVAVVCFFQIVTQIMAAFQYNAYTVKFLNEGNELASKTYGQAALRVVVNCTFFVIISPIILYFVYWKFYTNLRDRIEKKIENFNVSQSQ